MMSNVICDKPESINEFAPNLSKNIILNLLSNQPVDDFHPIINNITLFINYFNINLNKEINIIHDCTGDIINLSNNLNIKNWKEIKFSNELLNNFEFLKKYFI